MYSTSKEFSVQFVNAFDKLQEQRRKLFNMPEIDNLLNYLDKKNICIVNRESKNANNNNNNNFLYSLFAQFCFEFYFFSKNNTCNKKNKTILIDAGNGNNLGYIHQNLINQSIKKAFTIYQLANIIINEILKLINKIDYQIEIIVIDLLDTLFKTNRKNNNKYNLKRDFDENANLLNETLDNLIHISDKHFVIVSYNDIKNVTERSIISKFKNIVEINEQDDLILMH